MSELMGIITFPIEWMRDKRWDSESPHLMLTGTGQHEAVFAAGGCLTDGTNLVGLKWPEGQRVYRFGPDNGWALEERYEGTADETVEKVWTVLIQAMVEAVRKTKQEWGGLPPL
jgi:hypothetical protein